MIIEKLPEVQRLSDEDKMALAVELINETTVTDDGEVDENIIAMLYERLEEHRKDPDAVFTWEEVKARALAAHA